MPEIFLNTKNILYESVKKHCDNYTIKERFCTRMLYNLLEDYLLIIKIFCVRAFIENRTFIKEKS